MRIAIADASNLIYSDDYRTGWRAGFSEFADVKVFDISSLRPRAGNSIYSRKGWPDNAKLIASDIMRWQPDLVWCHHGRAASVSGFLERLQSVKTAVYLCDEPYESGATLQYSPRFNYIFTMDPCTMEAHRRAASRSEVFYLPPGVEEKRFNVGKRWDARELNCLFLGNAQLTPRPRYLKPIERHIEKTKILYWQTVRKGDRGWIGVDKYPGLYANAKLGLNVHRDPAMTQECWLKRVRATRQKHPPGMVECSNPPISWGTGFWNDYNLPASHLNPRWFEMAAAGCCVISDAHRTELARMFPFAPRAEDPEHFFELVRFYIDNDKQAHAVGEACRTTVLASHTYRHRAAEILIRTGLLRQSEANRFTYLGEPQGWLTIQDFDERGVSRSWAPTGALDRFDPRSGSAAMHQYGKAKQDGSLDFKPTWSP